MCILNLLLLGFIISSSVAQSSNSGSLFSHEDTLPSFYDDLEADSSATDEEYDDLPDNSADVTSATVTYNKNDYLGDMMKEYFGKLPDPPLAPPPRPEEEPEEEEEDIPPQTEPPQKGSSRTQSGGFGKIDISIQYGCCASSKQDKTQTPTARPTKRPEPVFRAPLPKNKTSRFLQPPSGLKSYPGFGYDEALGGYPPPFYAREDSPAPVYMGYDIKNYEEPKYNSKHESKHDTKRYYQHNNKNEQHIQQTEAPIENYYTPNYNQNNNNKKLYMYPSTRAVPRTTTTTTTTERRDTQNNINNNYSNNNKRYNNYRNYETTTSNMNNYNNYRYDTTTNNPYRYETTTNNNPYRYETTANNPYRYETTTSNMNNYNNYRYDTTTNNPYRYETTTNNNPYRYETTANNPYRYETTAINPYRYETTANNQYRYETTTNNNPYRYETTTTTTPKPTTRMAERTTNKGKYYQGQGQRQFDNSRVVVAQEQFYTIQNPAYYGTTLSPNSPIATLTRGLSVPAERSAFFTSERLLHPNFMYGSYMQPAMSIPFDGRYYPIPSIDKTNSGGPQRQQQASQNVVPKQGDNSNFDSFVTVTGPQSNGLYYNNHVTPRSILHDISRIVIKDVPKKDLYRVVEHEQPRQERRRAFALPEQYTMTETEEIQQTKQQTRQIQQQQQYQQQLQQQQQQQQQQQYRRSEPTFDTPTPISTTSTTTLAPSTWETPTHSYFQDSPSTESQDSENLIGKNREMFTQLQKQAHDYFTKAALEDFHTLLSKSIENKNIEVLPEERAMLDKKTEPNEEISLSILDYLTVYERYSDVLNDTELANHVLQDMDRAKEYLNMKLNKFWLELDVMEAPAEFLEKKAYYKSREKPSGIMNIFYDWYEKMICKPSDINIEDIKKRLVDIMKKERRYWLLLLRT